jgi:Fe-S cluster assembly protein SufB
MTTPTTPTQDFNPLRKELKKNVTEIMSDDYQYGFHDNDINYTFKARPGLDEQMVRDISALKKEPQWMLERRLQAYKTFHKYPMPTFLSTDALE